MKTILTIWDTVRIGNLSMPKVVILSFNLKANSFTGLTEHGDIRQYPLSTINR